MKNEILLTFDIDWCPDFMIDQVSELLINKRIRATFFVTHNSPAIDTLRKHPDLFELGMHPNFYPDSTHGKTEDEVMKTVKDLVPGAISMRTHGLYQNTNLLKKIVKDFGVKIDVSLLLPYTPYIQPHILNWGGNKEDELFRIPSFWEDDLETLSEKPSWILESDKFQKPGLKIFILHPIHIAINTNDYKQYENLKKAHSIPSLTAKDIERFINSGLGTKTFFLELIKKLSSENGGKQIKDIYEENKEKKYNVKILHYRSNTIDK